MEDGYLDCDVRKRLILAGINELDKHGAHDFSFRRVASDSGVSCAAPYRHFKNKNDFIVEIVKYINTKWDMLFDDILKFLGDDRKNAIIEACTATVRFFAANQTFKSILFTLLADRETSKNQEILHIVTQVKKLVSEYCLSLSCKTEEKIFLVSNLLGGLLAFSDISDRIEDEIQLLKSTLNNLL